jgi:microcystin-dependent protein
VTLTVAQIPPHSHSLHCGPGGGHWYGDCPHNRSWHPGGPTGETGGGQPHNNMPPFLAVNFLIVARPDAG